MTSSEALRLSEITKDFDGMRALDDASLEVNPGEIVGLIGPNGSGKTTLLNIASGVLQPTSGEVVIGSAGATRGRPHRFARRGVGRTFQQIRLFDEMSVADNVRVAAVAGRQDSSHVKAIVERLGLGDILDRSAATLPYGTQRRVEIARAMAGNPIFLLLDEPAAGMNETESAALMATIRSIHHDFGTAILIVDHDLDLIMKLCDRVYVLAEGRVIFVGTPEQVWADERVVEAYLGRAASKRDSGK